MAPPKKQIHNHGLGKALMNHRHKTRIADHQRELHTTEIYDNKPISVTQENDLDNFLNTAALAGTDFTAERQNVTILPSTGASSTATGPNPFLLSAADQAKLELQHHTHKNLLRVPRRPHWSDSTTPSQLERLERDSFLGWRKGLADLTDNRSLLLTPFERNLEVWRQLWRVVERSQLIVQIVDARNPLRFRCEDLEKYVDELSDRETSELESNLLRSSTLKPRTKANLLLVNKSDLLTENQRKLWAEYFDSQGIQYAFFSAANAAALQGNESEEFEDDQSSFDSAQSEDAEDQDSEEEDEDEVSVTSNPQDLALHDVALRSREDLASPSDPQLLSVDSTGLQSLCISTLSQSSTSCAKTKVLTVGELEQLFLRHAKATFGFHANSDVFVNADGQKQLAKTVVGLVGYPNVGKSSTINALVGSKKVSVSATPGKTKHFQTIHLSPEVILCDCPGLVFPQFASTKAELVCDGVLPIDQMREHTGPVSLITRRIPKPILEATYGLQLNTLPAEEGGDGLVTATEFLTTYAIARGFFTGGGGQGRPDESKAARPILKDYVGAKLLYCEPPPLPGLAADEFNKETRQLKLQEASDKKLAPTTRVPFNSDTYVSGVTTTNQAGSGKKSARSRALDQNFFSSNVEKGGAPLPSVKFGVKGRVAKVVNIVEPQKEGLARVRLYSRDIYSIDESGNPLSVPVTSNKFIGNGKKHFKGKAKRKKMRSGKGYDEL